MKDEAKTKKQLIEEIQDLRRFIGEYLNDDHSAPDLSNFNQIKASARQMKKSREKFMKFFQQNALPMGLSTQKEGCFVEVNDAFLKLTGFKRNEVIGYTETSLGLMTHEQRSVFLDMLNSKGRVENLEVQMMMKSRQPRHGLVNGVLMTLGREKFRLSVITDITGLKLGDDACAHAQQIPCRLPIDTPMPWFIG